MKLRADRPLCVAATIGCTASSANAAVISQRAVAETYIWVFAGFASLLLVVVLALVAFASRPQGRVLRVRNALLGLVLLGVIAGFVLIGLREAEHYSSIESAFLWLAGLLVVGGAAFVVHAFISARSRGG